MRISTKNFYESGSARLSDLQASLMKTQQQIQSGLKISTPSDDPIAASKILALNQSQSLNTQYASNRQNAKDPLQFSEAILTSVSELLMDVKDTLTAASTSTLADADRQVMAQDISGKLDQLLGLANTTDENGDAIFSGYKTGGEAFSKTAGGVVYNGDQGQRLAQVDSARQLATNETGDRIFQAGGNDVFKSLSKIVDLLNTPTSSSSDRAAVIAGLNSETTKISAAHDTVLAARSSVGTRLREIDNLDESGASRDTYLMTSLAELQGLDYTKAISDLTQEKTMLEAAQQSYVKIASMSLFSFLP
jgi:flagellar hook-associated protein 3 FlgL